MSPNRLVKLSGVTTRGACRARMPVVFTRVLAAWLATAWLATAWLVVLSTATFAQYDPIPDPDTIFDDYPQYIDPIPSDEYVHFLEPALVDTPGGDLAVRAWRYSASAGGIVESNNVLAGGQTALIVVHPLAIEDGQGWGFSQAYDDNGGYIFLGTFADNDHYVDHVSDVVRGFVDSTRGRVPLVMYGMPGAADTIRQKLYRDYTHQPSLAAQLQGQDEIEAYLDGWTGSGIPDKIPVVDNLQYAPGDVMAYDDSGYGQLKSYLQSYGIENILLAGYGADPNLATSFNSSLATSTSGYLNLKDDFNVFVVGDATMAAWPNTASPPPRFTRVSTRNAILEATVEDGVAATQVSWIEQLAHDPDGGPTWRGDELTCMAEWNNWQKTVDSETASRQLRAADYWESNLDPEWCGTDHFADEFDKGDEYNGYTEKVELLGQYDGRINVAKINAGKELVLHLPDPVEHPEEGYLRVRITWNRRDGDPTQEPVWTLYLHGEETPGDEVLQLIGRDVGADGWLTDVYETGLSTDVESTIVHLDFGDGWAYIDSMVVDLQMGAMNYMDDVEATMMAANWGGHGAAWMPGDFNGDGWVNEQDAAILAANWLQPYPASASAAVPEPSAAAGLLALAGFLCLLRRGRIARRSQTTGINES